MSHQTDLEPTLSAEDAVMAALEDYEPVPESAVDVVVPNPYGDLSTDPGLPCTPEYAQTLTEQALSAAETLYTTMAEILRVRAWEVMGYDSPKAYVLEEFSREGAGSISRAHRYRLARVITFTATMTDAIGDEVLDTVQISESALRGLPASADQELVDQIADAAEEAGGITQQIVDDALAAHKSRSIDDDGGGSSFDFGEAGGGGGGGESRSDAYTDATREQEDLDLSDGDDDGGHRPATSAPLTAPVSGLPTATAGAAIAGAQTFVMFTRALQQVAGIKTLLPGLLDHADEDQVGELRVLAEQAIETLGDVVKAADDY